MLWIPRPDQGVASFADLKGKKISTTKGTTAHVFLDRALRKNGLKPEDVERLTKEATNKAAKKP